VESLRIWILVIICLCIWACKKPDLSGEWKADWKETMNANTHLLAEKKIAVSVMDWLVRLDQERVKVTASGDSKRWSAQVLSEREKIGYCEVNIQKSDHNKLFLGLPNLQGLEEYTLMMVYVRIVL
jgi:hypothetical protein